MPIAYAVLAVPLSLMIAVSGMMKVRRDHRSTKIIHEVVGVPLKLFPVLAACEFAGGLGLLVSWERASWPSSSTWPCI